MGQPWLVDRSKGLVGYCQAVLLKEEGGQPLAMALGCLVLMLLGALTD